MPIDLLVLIADIAVVAVFGLLFVFLSYLVELKMRYFWRKEKEKATIIGELASISSKVLEEDHNLVHYPNIAFYLSHVRFIIKTCDFDVDHITVLPLAELSDYPDCGFDKEGFRKELISLPLESTLFTLVRSCSDLFGRIYRIKHPIKYAYFDFKKNLAVQILKFVLYISEKLSRSVMKHIDVDVEEVEEKAWDCNFVSSPDPA